MAQVCDDESVVRYMVDRLGFEGGKRITPTVLPRAAQLFRCGLLLGAVHVPGVPERGVGAGGDAAADAAADASTAQASALADEVADFWEDKSRRVTSSQPHVDGYMRVLHEAGVPTVHAHTRVLALSGRYLLILPSRIPYRLVSSRLIPSRLSSHAHVRVLAAARSSDVCWPPHLVARWRDVAPRASSYTHVELDGLTHAQLMNDPLAMETAFGELACLAIEKATGAPPTLTLAQAADGVAEEAAADAAETEGADPRSSGGYETEDDAQLAAEIAALDRAEEMERREELAKLVMAELAGETEDDAQLAAEIAALDRAEARAEEMERREELARLVMAELAGETEEERTSGYP
jgi:hypothetical protein